MGNTLPVLLEQRAAASPEATAYQLDDGQGGWQAVSWGEFAHRVHRLAMSLHAAGLRHGDRFAIVAPVSLQWELVHHAVLSLGAVVVGLDAHDLPKRIAAMAAKAGVAAFAITDTQCLAAMDAADWQRTRFVLALELSLQLPEGVRLLDWDDMASLAPKSTTAALPPVQPEDFATIIFTSGTTGEPKGIAYRHRQVCLAVDAICDAFPFAGPGTRMLCWLPLSNLFQRIVNLAAMTSGATTYLWADPRRVMEALPRVEPDIFIGVPRFLEKLYEGIRGRIASQGRAAGALAEWAWQVGRSASLRLLAAEPLGLWLRMQHVLADRLVLRRIRSVMGQRLRCMVTGSAPAPKHLLEEFHALGWLVLEAYGMSENVVPMAMNRIDGYRLGTVGRPVAGNEIRLGDDGSVRVRGLGVFEGYWGESNTATREADGFFITSDLGARDADGFLTLTGRIGEFIKTSTGRRIAPAPIEAALRSVPGVDQAVLFGDGRKIPVALCAMAVPVRDVEAAERLRKNFAAALSVFHESDRPGGVAILERPLTVDTNEMTPNLKVRRRTVEVLHEKLLSTAYLDIAARPTDNGLTLTIL
jgi:long-chain acyl-CoA synthetase